MKWSRIAAVLIVIAATLWIGSGMYGHGGDAASTKKGATAEAHPRFKVAVLQVRPEMHVKTITLSGRTEATGSSKVISLPSCRMRRARPRSRKPPPWCASAGSISIPSCR